MLVGIFRADAGWFGQTAIAKKRDYKTTRLHDHGTRNSSPLRHLLSVSLLRLYWPAGGQPPRRCHFAFAGRVVLHFDVAEFMLSPRWSIKGKFGKCAS